MRKVIVAAASAAILGTLGLTATAQAQPASHNTGRADPTVAKTAVAGIPTAFEVVDHATSKCTWTVTGLPGPVTAGAGLKNNCTELIDGVFPTATKAGSPVKIIAKGKAGTTTTTFTINVTVKASPGENDAVGVGSDTITPLTDALSNDFNATVSSTATHEYTWDAVNPITGAIGDSIAEKADCPSIPRPDGSSAGINQLATFTTSTSGPYCTNFARSSRPRGSSDPAFGPGGVAFVNLAGDAVTWSAQATTNAPATLTTAQLNAIYTCTDTNWSQVGGKSGTIQPFLPQSGSGTLSFWLAAIGVTTPGPCVSNNNNVLEENEGVNPVLNTPNAIFPYSVGDYIAQSEHSDKCLNTACTANSNGVMCTHTPSKNKFFCDVHGTMQLGEINGIAPISGSGTSETINTAFPSTFDRTLFNVVPYDPSTTDKIPGPTSPVGGVNLEQLFGASGYDCTNATAKAEIADYGFLTIATCGATS
jgi:ABC-type phosphate transport system substrate-binding protein